MARARSLRSTCRGGVSSGVHDVLQARGLAIVAAVHDCPPHSRILDGTKRRAISGVRGGRRAAWSKVAGKRRMATRRMLATPTFTGIRRQPAEIPLVLVQAAGVGASAVSLSGSFAGGTGPPLASEMARLMARNSRRSRERPGTRGTRWDFASPVIAGDYRLPALISRAPRAS